MKLRTATIPTLALLALLAALAPAVNAADPPAPDTAIVAGPGAAFSTFATPVALTVPGGALSFVNGDALRHNVMASGDFGDGSQSWCRGFPAGRCPLFWSAVVGPGVVTPVLGLEDLEPGHAYAFQCALHSGMRGTLQVVDA